MGDRKTEFRNQIRIEPIASKEEQGNFECDRDGE